MNRPAYACDRCGHWYTTDNLVAHNELPYESDAGVVNNWDICGGCMDSLRKQDILDDGLARWFAAGKGAEVKPRGVR